jgi:uncharacterized protein (DUF2236 family)
MDAFVEPGSIVRRVWGDADLVLLVFAGAAAEFALNRAVDWLFVSGALPRDPLGRLFSTAAYAQRIALGSQAEAAQAMAAIRAAHGAVERRRAARIPDWAHRDVLYLLIDYSERAFRAVHRPLAPAEQEELYAVFRRVGTGLGIPALPPDYAGWQADRALHIERDLGCGEHTAALYAAYRRALGPWRFALLRRVQGALAPERVRTLLRLPRATLLGRLLALYPVLARLGLRPAVRRALVPRAQLAAVRQLEGASGAGGRPR